MLAKPDGVNIWRREITTVSRYALNTVYTVRALFLYNRAFSLRKAVKLYSLTRNISKVVGDNYN